ncbi:hypothetical protein FGG08_002224 [Glutinoglossum americanum]|uniref:Uncharacterized protein n=1 Tax=Glutinoglossum americanum TaxID=1670608 RepID=A0A9P8KZE2_9PEZI|nr:hypothetical protein FGG08_002224 [Glutinoglossum americanum]
MQICSRPFLRPFANGGSSCTGSVSIPVFLVPSIASRSPDGASRSCTLGGYGRSLITRPPQHRSPSLSAAYGNRILSHDQVILCALNAAGPRAQTNPKELERVLNLASDHGAKRIIKHPQTRGPDNRSAVGRGLGYSAITGYVLHHLLGLYARSGHINACLRVWSQLQDIMDSAKLMAIEDFFVRFKSRSAAGDEDKYFGREPLDYLKPHFYYTIPGPTLADFFGVITENQEFELGRWLLYSRDADGPGIPESIYSNVFLAPLLVNFASATSDMQLLSKVVSKVSRPFSTDMVKALLRCEIDLRRWDGVQDILGFIHSHRKYRWGELELAKLVVAILRLGRDTSMAATDAELLAKSASLKRAKAILCKLMNGHFGQPKPLKKHYWPGDKYMNLLRYMVHTTLPSHFDIQHDVLDSWKPEDTRFLATTTFNTLLTGIVETRGSEEGRHFWDLWCRTPDCAGIGAGSSLQIIPTSRFPVLELGDENARCESSSRRLGSAHLGLLHTSERVKQIRRLERRWAGNGLKPNIGTVRIIIQGALKERAGRTGTFEYQLLKKQFSPARKILGKEGHVSNVRRGDNLDSIFVWGKEMFKRLGLDEREIGRELGATANM